MTSALAVRLSVFTGKLTLTLTPPTLLLYCLAQCGQQTGAEAMVPVSWVWGAQHGVRLARRRRPQLPDAGGELRPGVVLQDVGFPLAGALIHLQRDTGGDHGVFTGLTWLGLRNKLSLSHNS